MVEIDNHKNGLSMEAQLAIVKEAYPAVWLYIQSLREQLYGGSDLPKFDDNDEVVTWGAVPQDTPQDVNKKEC